MAEDMEEGETPDATDGAGEQPPPPEPVADETAETMGAYSLQLLVTIFHTYIRSKAPLPAITTIMLISVSGLEPDYC